MRKRLRPLQLVSVHASEHANPVRVLNRLHTQHPWCLQGLVMMVTDVADEAHGIFHIWGNMPEGASVLLRVHDFQPYFYIAGPVQAVSSSTPVLLSCCTLSPYMAATSDQADASLDR